MLDLNNITLIALSSVRIPETIQALQYSCRSISFGSVKLVSHTKPKNLPTNIEYAYIDQMSNIDQWNYSVIYKLGKYINTDYAILIHDNGYIIHPECWREEFLDYDYIGAPWPLPSDDYSFRDIKGEIIRVGNSVSLRSKRLIDLPVQLKLEWKPFHGYYNEDGYICVNYRHKYLEHEMKFADINVAKYFSHETLIPETVGIKPFAFHNNDPRI